MELLQFEFLNNTFLDYLWFLGSFAISILVIQIIKVASIQFINKYFSHKSERTKEILTKLVKRYPQYILSIITFYFCARFIKLASNVSHALDIIVTALLIYFFALLVTSMIDLILIKYEHMKADDAEDGIALHWVNKLLKAVVWTISGILFLNNIGIKIGALMAGLGIGGIAIAYASKAILEDIFSYFMIFLDKPFEIGDFIISGEIVGTVEYIGIRSTRLKSQGGEQLVIPNKDITNSRMKNFNGMQERRIVFHLGVTYDTSTQLMKEIPDIIQGIIEKHENTRFDRVHFTTFGDFSLNFEIVYFVLSSDYKMYMDIQQSINLMIKAAFEERKIEFAFPSQTIYIPTSTSK